MTFKKGFITVAALFYLTLSLPFAASIFVKWQTSDRIYHSLDEVPQKEYALVLGAAAYPSRLSDILQDRVDTAIELFNAGKVSKIIMTGAGHEAKAMADYARKAGVAPESIIEDMQGLNTLASLQNNRTAIQMVIVSQDFHLPRAVYIARKLGIDAVGLTSDKHEYAKIFQFKRREILATAKAMLDLTLRSL